MINRLKKILVILSRSRPTFIKIEKHYFQKPANPDKSSVKYDGSSSSDSHQSRGGSYGGGKFGGGGAGSKF